MATRTITYTQCDGCLRSTLDDEIEIVSTKAVPRPFSPPKTVALCADCVEAEKYYCRLCDRVHTDDNPCDPQLREIERAEAYAKEMIR